MLDMLLALLAIGRTIYSGWLVKRVVSAAAFAFALVIIISILLSALLAGGFYTLYLTLLQHGFDPLAAYGIAGGLMLLSILVIALGTVLHLKRMFAIPKNLLEEKLPVAGQAREVMDAFLKGFAKEPDAK
jgi:hypothetical protein